MRLRRRADLPLPAEPDCAEVGAVLQAYLDDELETPDAESVAAHLTHCERCGIEAETVGKVIAAIERQRPDLDQDALERLAGFVDELAEEDGDG